MTGYVAITDFDWFSYLSRRSDWVEVNFWQPSATNLLNPPAGMPFFFKLRAEYGSPIVGFGYFSWRSVLPAWIAWDNFHDANGAPSREDMLSRIGRLRRDPEIDYSGNYEIGCLLIARPVFFAKADWVRPPANMSPNVQRGKGYDIAEGEGRRVLLECRQRAAHYGSGIAPAEGANIHGIEGAERFGPGRLVRPRLGQGGFRTVVMDTYGRQCAISTEHSLPALEAAHIKPYSDGGEHSIQNGLLLRADIHRLFDHGLVTVTDEHRFLVSKTLRDRYANGRVYYELQERIERAGKIHLPSDPAFHPDRALLRWHSRTKFVA